MLNTANTHMCRNFLVSFWHIRLNTGEKDSEHTCRNFLLSSYTCMSIEEKAVYSVPTYTYIPLRDT